MPTLGSHPQWAPPKFIWGVHVRLATKQDSKAALLTVLRGDPHWRLTLVVGESQIRLRSQQLLNRVVVSKLGGRVQGSGPVCSLAVNKLARRQQHQQVPLGPPIGRSCDQPRLPQGVLAL